jgi:hypothetical protein
VLQQVIGKVPVCIAGSRQRALPPRKVTVAGWEVIVASGRTKAVTVMKSRSRALSCSAIPPESGRKTDDMGAVTGGIRLKVRLCFARRLVYDPGVSILQSTNSELREVRGYAYPVFLNGSSWI